MWSQAGAVIWQHSTENYRLIVQYVLINARQSIHIMLPLSFQAFSERGPGGRGGGILCFPVWLLFLCLWYPADVLIFVSNRNTMGVEGEESHTLAACAGFFDLRPQRDHQWSYLGYRSAHMCGGVWWWWRWWWGNFPSKDGSTKHI